MEKRKRGFFEKLCQKYAYAVAIREKGSGAPFKVKYPTIHEWWADPFIVNNADKHCLFVERMSSYRQNGDIAVASVVNGEIGKFHVVLRESFHLSFPNVFSWKGNWYMLPETKGSQQVRLYRAKHFPDSWELDTVLLDQVSLVDHALYPVEDGFLVVSNDITDEREAGSVK